MKIDASPSPLTREHHTDDFCGCGAQNDLQQGEVGEPWHLWVNFPGPHDPYDPTVAQLARYDGIKFPGPLDNDHQAIRRAYGAMITGIDDWVGKLVAEVKRRGELDNTYIIFASDHGEMLGDHGRWNKSMPYEQSVHVPLVIAGPGIAADQTSNALVELIDLAATITDLADLKVPNQWDAKSIKPILRNDPNVSHREVQISQLMEWAMIYDGQYKYVRTDDKPDVLYDLSIDEMECCNLAKDMPEKVAQLKQQLETQLAQ